MESKAVILLVDDEDAFLEIASTQLENKGFTTVKANGAFEGLEKAASLLPDFILSDIYMPPGPSGWEFALALHHNPKTKEIPFAFFTSLHDPWMELRKNRKEITDELGEITFFSKTEDVEMLGEQVKKRMIDMLKLH